MILDQNYGGTGKLRLTAADPASFRVLVYYSTDWEAMRRSDAYALAAAAVGADGNWLSQILLAPGTYHVVATGFRTHLVLAPYLLLE